jgi:glycopeptide antibiotics resistance protein
VFASTFLCALGSISVEILQLPVWSRSTDIDDVLTNTLGGLLGALAGVVVLRLIRRRPAVPAHDDCVCVEAILPSTLPES